jgi:hypothetical protein
MISLDNISNIRDVEDNLFNDDNSPIVKQLILYKEEDQYDILKNLKLEQDKPRYGIFIDIEGCQKLNNYKIDCHHYYKFENDELFVVLDETIESERRCDNEQCSFAGRLRSEGFAPEGNPASEICDECYITDCNVCENYGTFKIDKYKVEGREGYFWLIICNHFFIYGDLPSI